MARNPRPLTEEDINGNKRTAEYYRGEKIRDCLTTITVWGIYTASIVLFAVIVGIIAAYGWYVFDNTLLSKDSLDMLNSVTKYLMVGGVGYIGRYIQSSQSQIVEKD